ncbi:hypothetical protein ACFOON_03075 [Novosphingobium piscinae]|nr:hypothetical protein [Novosphingobium piscinae]
MALETIVMLNWFQHPSFPERKAREYPQRSRRVFCNDPDTSNHGR